MHTAENTATIEDQTEQRTSPAVTEILEVIEEIINEEQKQPKELQLQDIAEESNTPLRQNVVESELSGLVEEALCEAHGGVSCNNQSKDKGDNKAERTNDNHAEKWVEDKILRLEEGLTVDQLEVDNSASERRSPPQPQPRKSVRARRPPKKFDDFYMNQMVARSIDNKLSALSTLVQSGVLNNLDSETAHKMALSILQ